MLAAALLVAALSSAPSAQATIIKGWAVFEDNAFADTASMLSGVEGDDYYFWGVTEVPTTVEEAITGPDLTKGIEFITTLPGVQVGFTDNVVTNGPGDDLALFDTFDWGGFYVAVDLGGGSFSSYVWCSAAGWTFTEGGLTQYPTLVDLDDFGLTAGQTTTAVRFSYAIKDKAAKKKKGGYDGPSGIGALSGVVPEATTLTILGAGILAMARKRRKKASGARAQPPESA